MAPTESCALNSGDNTAEVLHMFKLRNGGINARVIIAACMLAVVALSATAQTANVAPVISGTPPATVAPGQSYTFRPTASDANGDRLRFSLSNRPYWISINSSTGQIQGTAPRSSYRRTFSNLVLGVSDGRKRASLPAFSITIGTVSVNREPVISGTPSGSVLAGSAYSFTPTASDADGNALGFSITSKPAWSTFSVASGALTGTPTTAQVGAYPNIVITVSDGIAARSLPVFSINVTAPVVSGTANLSWVAPTKNTDGSALTNLAGYRVYHGTSASALNDVFLVPGATSLTYTVGQLPKGTHYFAVAAYTTAGAESALSAVGNKTIL
jgi:hypothetical protein